MPNRPVTDDERDQMVALAKSGRSIHAIAQELGRSPATVRRYCLAAGLSFDRSKVEQANRARRADAAAKRQALQHRMLDEAGRMLDQLHQPALVYSFGGRDNVYREHTLDSPPVSDQRALVLSARTLVDGALRLDERDQQAQGVSAVDQWLRTVVGDATAAAVEAATDGGTT